MFLYFLVVQDIWGRGVLDFSFLGGGGGQGMGYMDLFGTVFR